MDSAPHVMVSTEHLPPETTTNPPETVRAKNGSHASRAASQINSSASCHTPRMMMSAG